MWRFLLLLTAGLVAAAGGVVCAAGEEPAALPEAEETGPAPAAGNGLLPGPGENKPDDGAAAEILSLLTPVADDEPGEEMEDPEDPEGPGDEPPPPPGAPDIEPMEPGADEPGAFPPEDGAEPADPGAAEEPGGEEAPEEGAAAVEAGLGPGVIEGVVYDERRGEPMERVIVAIPALQQRIPTMAAGTFRFSGLPLGRHVVTFAKRGYKRKDVEVVIEEAGTPVAMEEGLEERQIEVAEDEYLQEDFNVVEEYVEEPMMKLTFGEEKSEKIASGIGREGFEQTGVGDVGAAVGKIAGANVVGGKFAVVRGLADRYVATLFNGAQIATADPTKKTIQLDLFPTSAVEELAIYKTYAPDLPLEFGGGTIDIIGRRYTADPLTELGAKYTKVPDDPRVTFAHPNRSLGFFGADDTSVYGQLFDELAGSGELRFVDSDFPDAVARWTGLIGGQSFLPRRDEVVDGLSFKATVSRLVELTGDTRVGFIFAGRQGSGESYNQSPKFRQVDGGRTWDQEDFGQQVEWSAYGSVALEMGDNHKIVGTYFKTDITEDSATFGRRQGNLGGGTANTSYGDLAFNSQGKPYLPEYGLDPTGRGYSAILYGEFDAFETVEREYDIAQLRGEHLIEGAGVEIDWRLTRSTSEESRPRSSFFGRSSLDFGSPELKVREAQAIEDLDNTLTPLAAQIYGLDPDTTTWYDVRPLLARDFGEAFVRGREENVSLPILAPGGVLPSGYNAGKTAVSTTEFFGYSSSIQQSPLRARLETSSIKEESTESAFDLQFPLFGDRDSERSFYLKGGASHYTRKREVRAAIAEIIITDTGLGFLPGVQQRDNPNEVPSQGSGQGTGTALGEFLAANPDAIINELSRTGRLPTVLNGVTEDRLIPEGDSSLELEAAYLGGRWFWDPFFLEAGMRYEKEFAVTTARPAPFSGVNPNDGVNDPLDRATLNPPPRSSEDFLPSVSLGGTFFDGKVEVLAAWSQTVARPTFNEFAQLRTFDPVTGAFPTGFPRLDNSALTNTDLSLTYRPNENVLLRTSVFNKDIEDPIITVFVQSSGDTLITYRNGLEGIITGAEFEGSLTGMGPFFASGNVTVIDASLDYLLEANLGAVEGANFQFQPSTLMNLTLGYANEDWDLTATLVYNYTGEYASILRTSPTGSDVTRAETHSLDFILRKVFDMDTLDFELSFGVQNLVATPEEFTQFGRLYERRNRPRAFWVGGEISF